MFMECTQYSGTWSSACSMTWTLAHSLYSWILLSQVSQRDQTWCYSKLPMILGRGGLACGQMMVDVPEWYHCQVDLEGSHWFFMWPDQLRAAKIIWDPTLIFQESTVLRFSWVHLSTDSSSWRSKWGNRSRGWAGKSQLYLYPVALLPEILGAAVCLPPADGDPDSLVEPDTRCTVS